MSKTNHIVLVNSSLVCGGAERVLCTLANKWVTSGTSVTIVTIYSESLDHYVLDTRVQRVSLNADKVSRNVLHGAMNNIWRILKLRNTFRSLKPTVIVSFQDRNNIRTLLAAMGLSIPVVISERSNPQMRKISFVWEKLRNAVYRFASALVLQTNSLRQWGESIVEPEKIYVVPNPAPAPTAITGGGSKRPEKIVAVGRLVELKGFDILLEALARCEKKWPLTIIGEGPERKRLKLLAAHLGIASQVELLGKVNDPSVYFRDASLFVLSSRFEGFPNVLVEAMANGLPAVSFECAWGPADIIRHGIDGLLVPPGDVQGLSEAIDMLMMNPTQRTRLADRASEVVSRFSSDDVISMWNALISDVCHVKS